MSQPLSLLGPTISPPRAMPSMPLSPAAQDTLTPLLPLLPPPLLPQLALPTQLAMPAHFTSPSLWPTPMEPWSQLTSQLLSLPRPTTSGPRACQWPDPSAWSDMG